MEGFSISVIVVGSVLVLLILYLLIVKESAPSFKFVGSHAFIPGGSSGIGLATAIELVSRGTSVTIVARKQATIDSAVEEIKKHCKHGARVIGISADVSDSNAVRRAIDLSLQEFKTIDAVVFSSGASRPGYFEEIPEADFERLAKVNYLGAIYVLKNVIPHMKQNGGGRVILVGSMLSQSNIHGMSAYSPTKFAIRGLAEGLHMEYKPYNIHFSVCNPPDVDTPMLHEENKLKPIECKVISEGSGLFTPKQMADGIIDCLKSWRFAINYGFDGILLEIFSIGTAPEHSILHGLVQLFGMGLLRVVYLGYRWTYNGIVAKYHRQRKLGIQQHSKNE